MVEISEITIIEIGLMIAAGILLPVVISLWRTSTKRAKAETEHAVMLKTLSQDASDGKIAHDELRSMIVQMREEHHKDIKQIIDRLSRMEGKLD